jgi:hypothetical protein
MEKDYRSILARRAPLAIEDIVSNLVIPASQPTSRLDGVSSQRGTEIGGGIRVLMIQMLRGAGGEIASTVLPFHQSYGVSYHVALPYNIFRHSETR